MENSSEQQEKTSDSAVVSIRVEKKKGFYSGRAGYERYLFVRAVYFVVDLIVLLPLLLVTLLSRLFPKPVDVGLGPLPIINSRYHKKAMEHYGYRCETFVYHTWYFTQEFDINIGRFCPRALGPYVSYILVLFRYKCIYTYFSGGPLGFTTILACCEPFLLRLAGIRTVIMPFGADVQVLTRAKNKAMTHACAMDYPSSRLTMRRTASLVDWWTRGADHIVSGCDWVDYMYYWDTLMLSHFVIDTDALVPSAKNEESGSALRLLHAPNHRNLKGTSHILKAVEELKSEGCDIELVLAEGVPNTEMPDLIRSVDIVVDQLVIGWYAMFSLESMALGKPVICHVRQEYHDLYVEAGLIEPGELPLIDANVRNIKEVLRQFAGDKRAHLGGIGRRSRAFAERHHSVASVGKVFDRINRAVGISPTCVAHSKSVSASTD
ncbi:glycosyltransferase family protein [Thalassospira sp. SM2505]